MFKLSIDLQVLHTQASVLHHVPLIDTSHIHDLLIPWCTNFWDSTTKKSDNYIKPNRIIVHIVNLHEQTFTG